MKRSTIVGSAAAWLCLGLASPMSPVEAQTSTGPPSAAEPTESCLGDLRALDDQMEEDGYWRGNGYGYGYPMDGYGYGYSYSTDDDPEATMAGYQSARPGYDIRTLVAAADILARDGQEQSCETMIATTRDLYADYLAGQRRGRVPPVDVSSWRATQIAAAQPVTESKATFRSDELLGTDVRNEQGQSLGSVADLVMTPQTGTIAYLVIARGGMFGLDENYVPVPWEDFKITPNVDLLLLDSTKDAMDAAPQVNKGQFTANGRFDRQSAVVDAYWKPHMTSRGSTGPNG